MEIKFSLIFCLMLMPPMAYAGAACISSNNKLLTAIPKKSPLRIDVDLAAKKYKANDDIILVVTLWNRSPRDLYISRKEGFYTDVSVRIKNHSTGRELETAFVPTALPPPPISVKDLLKIARCNYVKEDIELSLRDYGLQPGRRYDLFVEYHSSLPKYLNFGVDIFDSENGAVISTPVSIDIVGN